MAGQVYSFSLTFNTFWIPQKRHRRFCYYLGSKQIKESMHEYIRGVGVHIKLSKKNTLLDASALKYLF